MSVNLRKGQKVDLTKNNPSLKNIIVGLGWQADKEIDLDTSAFLLNENDKVNSDGDFIFYNNLKHSSGSVEHLGDNNIGSDTGDAEQIKVNLSKIPANICKISFAVTVYESEKRRQNFRKVKNAYIRIVDKSNNKELLRYNLNEDFSVETAVIVGELYRNKGEWKFNAIGAGFSGGLEAIGRNFGLKTENKTERISVSLYPAVKLDIKKLASMNGVTLSEIVNNALAEFIEKHRQEIKDYDDFIKNR